MTTRFEADEVGYAQQVNLTVEKCRELDRKAVFYLAQPLLGSKGNPVGAFVVDNLEQPELLCDAKGVDRTRAEHQLQVAGVWLEKLLQGIPERVIRRAI